MPPGPLPQGVFAPGALGRAPRPGGAPGRAGGRVGQDGPAPRHLAQTPTWEVPVGSSRQMPTRRRGLNWLMLIPTIMPLLVPLYNRDSPRLFGLPFFYWYQLACVLLMIIVITFVYLMTKGRRPRW